MEENEKARPIPWGFRHSIKRELVGPRHDPYEFVSYTVTNLDGVTVTLTACALWGTTTFRINDVDIQAGEFMSESEWETVCHVWFEAITGLTVRDVEDAEGALYSDYADIRDAEMQAGWDPNP